jgi:hypothetical protein
VYLDAPDRFLCGVSLSGFIVVQAAGHDVHIPIGCSEIEGHIRSQSASGRQVRIKKTVDENHLHCRSLHSTEHGNNVTAILWRRLPTLALAQRAFALHVRAPRSESTNSLSAGTADWSLQERYSHNLKILQACPVNVPTL